jgi:DNA-binding NarL/FixJ family response regulator
MTVMGVDDHLLLRQAISQILRAQPEITRVIEVQTYVAARKQAASQPPEIVWLEMQMTDSDGLTAMAHLRKMSPASSIMVLADREDEPFSCQHGVTSSTDKSTTSRLPLRSVALIRCRIRFI